ncbi:MAG: TonB-dependent receptor [Gemmatimonas sp.]|nr:TonB-dependent receptor [Gemmatimonas sp.]
MIPRRLWTGAVMAFLAGLALVAPSVAAGQNPEGTLRVRAIAGNGPVDAATVRSDGVGSLTNAAGEAVLHLHAGPHEVTVEKLGYADAVLEVEVAAGRETLVEMSMTEQAEEIEGIVVTSTRTERRIEDEPVRVEVLAREEVEEKLLMTPGDIAMMLNETSGLRVQNTSPSLGGANVRIQGLSGRYTQILSDGLPLYGGQSGSLSMLQIPPMDLGQVEVIKGAASALYGSSALGGVVNLISRRPAEDEREILLNQTTLGGSDGVLWLADELGERWGYTLLGGLHRQGQADVDEDGWSDLPGYQRAVLRPRLFWNDGAGRSLLVTLGITLEDREGGTRDGRLTPAGTEFPEQLQTRRADVGVIGRFLVAGGSLLTLRASAMGQRHEHLFGETLEQDLHSNAFGEVTYGSETAGHIWLIGAALQRESYEADDVDGFDFGYTIPSLFLQDEYSPVRWLTLAASGRLDRHSEYGPFFNPRVSLLLRPGQWTTRASVGTGYFAPTPFTEETEAVGLGRLEPLGELHEETVRSASLDVGREFGALEVNGTLFGSIVDDALQTQLAGDRLRLVNAEGPTRTWGGELLARWHAEPFHVTATYTHLRSTESDPDGAGRREVPLTPRHAAGIVGMWEAEGQGRIGLELYYTGKQELEENPYRTMSRPYFVTGLLVERRFGNARLFVNAENLLDARQTAYDPLILPARSPEGRWTTDAWAPLEGRVFNAGIRYEF